MEWLLQHVDLIGFVDMDLWRDAQCEMVRRMNTTD